MTATDHFDMLFGGEGKPAEDSKDAGDGNADQLMDMLGVMIDDKEDDKAVVDDAIVIEDDAAIIVEDDAP